MEKSDLTSIVAAILAAGLATKNATDEAGSVAIYRRMLAALQEEEKRKSPMTISKEVMDKASKRS